MTYMSHIYMLYMTPHSTHDPCLPHPVSVGKPEQRGVDFMKHFKNISLNVLGYQIFDIQYLNIILVSLKCVFEPDGKCFWV